MERCPSFFGGKKQISYKTAPSFRAPPFTRKETVLPNGLAGAKNKIMIDFTAGC